MELSDICYPAGIRSEIGNYRTTMEDTYYIDSVCHTYAVFDGHGGPKLSKFLEKISPSKFKDLDFEEKSITNLFMNINNEARKELGLVGDGSTLVLVKIFPTKNLVKCAWVGDSEAWLISDTGSYDNLTPELHNGYNTREISRVKEAGGYISFGRLSRMLAVTRAFGNYLFDLKGLTDKPDISTVSLRSDHKFLVLACDGIREQYGNSSKAGTDISEIASFILEKYNNGVTDMNDLSAALVSKAFELGSRDNATAIIIDLKPNSINIAPIFLIDLPENSSELGASYSYFLTEHREIMRKMGINNCDEFPLPCFIKQEIISRAQFGNDGVNKLRQLEKHLGCFFIWSPCFENVHSTYFYIEPDLIYNGTKFKGPEHAYQASKFEGLSYYQEASGLINKASDIDAYSIGRKYKLRPNWPNIKFQIMTNILGEKFKNPFLSRLLKSTNNFRLARLCPCDSYWGSGQDGRGKNMLSEALTIVRNNI